MNKAKWMSGKYGIAVHYLSQICCTDGTNKDFNEMAEMFDVDRFCDEAKDMGASWVLFPFGQNSGYYWSENPYIEERISGRCSRRDLPLEIAKGLSERGIRFISYLPVEVDDQSEEIRNAFFWDKSADKKEFMEIWMKIVEYYGEKFGNLMAGWWFDGAYKSSEKSFKRTHDWDNSRFDKERWLKCTHAGNKDRVIAMCTGANHMKYVFEEEEYLPGETNSLDKFPWDYDSNQKQWHAFTYLDGFWGGFEEMKKIPDPRFTDKELFEYVKKCLDLKGAVTLNIGIYGEGYLSEKTVLQLKRMKDYLNN